MTASSPASDLYEHDFYAWTQAQAAALRAKDWATVDLEHLAEEIESLGRNEFDKLVSFYALVMLHMLKWEHQPNLRSRSWAVSIDNHREHAAEVLSENPGLKSRLGEALERAYRRARGEAIAETGLRKSTFPDTCPFTPDEVLTRSYEYD